jgi:hypothetical protein
MNGGDSATFSSIFGFELFCSQAESTPAPPVLTRTDQFFKLGECKNVDPPNS